MAAKPKHLKYAIMSDTHANPQAVALRPLVEGGRKDVAAYLNAMCRCDAT